MQGEIQFIKKQIFGGFNREDVVAYIAKMAKERNEAREACKEATIKLEALNEEIKVLKLELLELENSKIVIDVAEDRDSLQDEVEHLRGYDDKPDVVNDQNAAPKKRIKAKVAQKAVAGRRKVRIKR